MPLLTAGPQMMASEALVGIVTTMVSQLRQDTCASLLTLPRWPVTSSRLRECIHASPVSRIAHRASHSLLAFRALCVYQGAARTWVGRFLFAAWLGMFGIWMSGIPDLRGAWFEGIGPVWLENSGACAFLPGLDHLKCVSRLSS